MQKNSKQFAKKLEKPGGKTSSGVTGYEAHFACSLGSNNRPSLQV